MLEEDESIFAYTRTLDDEKLLVVCNFTDKEVPFELPEEFLATEKLIANYNRDSFEKEITLKSYEAFVLKL